MEIPQEIGTDPVPSIPLCVHAINTKLAMGLGADGSVTELSLSGHDEHGTEMIVDVMLAACLLEQLSIRLQEYQMAVSLEGMGTRQPKLFRYLRSRVMDRQPNGGHDHGH